MNHDTKRRKALWTHPVAQKLWAMNRPKTPDQIPEGVMTGSWLVNAARGQSNWLISEGQWETGESPLPQWNRPDHRLLELASISGSAGGHLGNVEDSWCQDSIMWFHQEFHLFWVNHPSLLHLFGCVSLPRGMCSRCPGRHSKGQRSHNTVLLQHLGSHSHNTWRQVACPCKYKNRTDGQGMKIKVEVKAEN